MTKILDKHQTKQAPNKIPLEEIRVYIQDDVK